MSMTCELFITGQNYKIVKIRRKLYILDPSSKFSYSFSKNTTLLLNGRTLKFPSCKWSNFFASQTVGYPVFGLIGKDLIKNAGGLSITYTNSNKTEGYAIFGVTLPKAA